MDNTNIPNPTVGNISATNTNVASTTMPVQNVVLTTSKRKNWLILLIISIITLLIVCGLGVLALAFNVGNVSDFIATVPGLNQIIPLTPKQELIKAMTTPKPSWAKSLETNGIFEVEADLDIVMPSLSGTAQKQNQEFNLKSATSSISEAIDNSLNENRSWYDWVEDYLKVNNKSKIVYSLGGGISLLNLGDKAIEVELLTVDSKSQYLKVNVGDQLIALAYSFLGDSIINDEAMSYLQGKNYIDISSLTDRENQNKKVEEVLAALKKSEFAKDIDEISDMALKDTLQILKDMDSFAKVEKIAVKDNSSSVYTVNVDNAAFAKSNKALLEKWVNNILDANTLPGRFDRLSKFVCSNTKLLEINQTEADCLKEAKKMLDEDKPFEASKLDSAKKDIMAVFEVLSNNIEIERLDLTVDRDSGLLSGYNATINIKPSIIRDMSKLDMFSEGDLSTVIEINKLKLLFVGDMKYFETPFDPVKPTNVIKYEDLMDSTTIKY